jgi:hypothetical protein
VSALHVRRLSTGKDVVLRTVSLPARAALDSSGLVFVDGWHVRHVATATIAAALAD